MNANYDKESDVLYLRFSTKTIDESEESTRGIIVDYSKDREIVGVEVLNLSRYATLSQVSQEYEYA
jgi:uncharacterized protein YuzE